MVERKTHQLVGKRFLVASCAAAILTMPACGSLFPTTQKSNDAVSNNVPLPPVTVVLKPATVYEGCKPLQSDIQNTVEESKARLGRNGGMVENSSAPQNSTPQDANAPTAGAPSAGVPGSIGTNVQHSGVDETDGIKVSNHHIFVRQSSGVLVVDRSSLRKIGFLSTPQVPSPQIMTDGDKLVLTGQEKWEPGVANTKSHILVFGLQQGKLPVQERDDIFEGSIQEQRLAHHHVVAVMFDSLPQAQKGASPVQQNQEKVSDLSCSNYYATSVNTGSTGATKVLAISVEEPQLPAIAMGFLGYFSFISLSERSLTLVNQTYPGMGRQWNGSEENIFLTHFDLNTSETEGKTKLTFENMAVGAVPGRATGTWAFQDFPDQKALVVATTEGNNFQRGGAVSKFVPVSQNKVRALSSQNGILSTIGESMEFGKGESIQSVRYVGNVAYVVTFRRIDPLFAIDLSDVSKPQILGELTLPGFSSYLHPMPQNLLVGVGMAGNENGLENGVQISLFDTADPTHLKLLESQKFIGNGNSSTALYQPHSFFADPDQNIIGVPLTEYNALGAPMGSAPASFVPQFRGILLFSTAHQKLEKIGSISYSDGNLDSTRVCGVKDYWIDQQNRLFKLDGKYILTSALGAVAFEGIFAKKGQQESWGGDCLQSVNGMAWSGAAPIGD